MFHKLVLYLTLQVEVLVGKDKGKIGLVNQIIEVTTRN